MARGLRGRTPLRPAEASNRLPRRSIAIGNQGYPGRRTENPYVRGACEETHVPTATSGRENCCGAMIHPFGPQPLCGSMASARQLSKVLRTNVVLEVVDRRAEAAAVNATASGSQHSTIRAMSHRMARSLSVSSPRNSATHVWVQLRSRFAGLWRSRWRVPLGPVKSRAGCRSSLRPAPP
jgi:hypothetical protein